MNNLQDKSGRKALGKGLRALIPSNSLLEKAGAASGILLCPIEKIVPNEDQPRQSFDEGKLRELTESIRSKGVIQPLVVRKSGEQYQIVAGERRWRAAKMAGLKNIPVIVKDLSDAEMLEVALIENIQREDLNPLEEAEAYRQLVEEHGLTQEQLAERVGRQRSTVANTLRLLKLPEEIRRYLLTGDLSMGHARAILGIGGNGANVQLALAKRVVQDKLSVRQCEDLVRKALENKSPARTSNRRRSYGQAEYRLIESLQRRLGTKVDLRPSRKGGQVVIHYYANEELDRIISIIEGK